MPGGVRMIGRSGVCTPCSIPAAASRAETRLNVYGAFVQWWVRDTAPAIERHPKAGAAVVNSLGRSVVVDDAADKSIALPGAAYVSPAR